MLMQMLRSRIVILVLGPCLLCGLGSNNIKWLSAQAFDKGHGASKALQSDVVRSGANRDRFRDSIMDSSSFDVRTR